MEYVGGHLENKIEVIADDEKKRIDRLFSASDWTWNAAELTPQMPLFTTGVQEPRLLRGITIPALYAASPECLVLRFQFSTIALGSFRREVDLEAQICESMPKVAIYILKDVETHTHCGGEVRSADKGQLDYADACKRTTE